jgi:hypothetical protein
MSHTRELLLLSDCFAPATCWNRDHRTVTSPRSLKNIRLLWSSPVFVVVPILCYFAKEWGVSVVCRLRLSRGRNYSIVFKSPSFPLTRAEHEISRSDAELKTIYWKIESSSNRMRRMRWKQKSCECFAVLARFLVNPRAPQSNLDREYCLFFCIYGDNKKQSLFSGYRKETITISCFDKSERDLDLLLQTPDILTMIFQVVLSFFRN